MAQHIYEGTAQELVSVLAKRSKGRFRLTELEAEDESKEKPEALPDPDNAASIALLRSWIAEAPTDPEAIREAEEDLREFKRNMNKPRKETGARLHFPEVE